MIIKFSLKIAQVKPFFSPHTNNCKEILNLKSLPLGCRFFHIFNFKIYDFYESLSVLKTPVSEGGIASHLDRSIENQ